MVPLRVALRLSLSLAAAALLLFSACLLLAYSQALSVHGQSMPSGTIVLIISSSCPTNFTEVTALSGFTLIGTKAANGDVGTTGGADTITPNGSVSAPGLTMNAYTPAGSVAAPTFTGSSGTVPAQTFTGSSGTVPAQTISWPAGVPAAANESAHTHSVTAAGTVAAPTFTGSALATHAHELPEQLVSNVLTRYLAAATFGTGTSRAAIGQVTTTANTTSAAVALSQAVSAGTPAGTNSAPAFTGSAVTSGAGSAHTHTLSWPAGVPTNGTVSFTPAGTNGTASFTPAGTNNGPAFTGNSATLTGTVGVPGFTGTQFDNRSAYTKVIFCSKN